MTTHLTAVASKDGAGTSIPGGVQFNDTSGSGAGPFNLASVTIDTTGNEILGTTADAAVATDANGSINAHIRGLVKIFAAALASAAGALFSKVTDGTNTAAVKAASTAAAATDPALVVSLSPNGVTRAAGPSDSGTLRVTIDSGQIGSLGPVTKANAISFTRATDESPWPTTDAGPNWTTVWGVSGVPFNSADQHSAAASVTDAPTSGQKIVIDDLIFSTDTAMSVTFKEETSGTVVAGPFYVPANFVGQITPRGKGKKLATADKKLQVITSVAGNITVSVGYHSEA